MGRFNQTTITVVNGTTSQLERIDEDHSQGGPRTSIPRVIQAGDRATFVTVQLPGEADGGSDIGFVMYDIGGGGRNFWEIRWRNLEVGRSEATSSLFGDDAELFDTDAEMPEEGGDVEATFTLTDAPRLSVEDFLASMPVEADEPTLRFGDETIDGWVEYLQRRLINLGFSVEMNGSFDEATFNAVIVFQQLMNATPPSVGLVLVDGIVGHQTWALLREEDARPPSTDGLEPHTFVESGREARWLTEDSAFVFLADEDRLVVQGVSTGDTPIESGGFFARFMIVLPSSTEEPLIRDRPIVTADGGAAGPGDLVFAEFEGAADRARNVENPTGENSFSFQVVMPDEFGGDVSQSLFVPFA